MEPTYENKQAYKRVKKVILEELENAYNNGYNDGKDDAQEDYSFGFDEGVQEERSRIRQIFEMNIQWALESNKGSDVIFFNRAKQMIEPIEIDFSPEAYQRELEKDGF